MDSPLFGIIAACRSCDNALLLFGGLVCGYLGLLIILWEICVEPELIKRPLWVKVLTIGLVFAFFDVFTIGVVASRAPVKVLSYAMRKGDYPSGTSIAGITWDSHLTDLRVLLTNPIDDDYDNLDVEVQPDKWTYKAALLNNSVCDLSPMGEETVFVATNVKGGSTTITATRVGNAFDAQDNVGDIFTPLASKSGYRLRCSKLPAHFTVQIVFAVVTLYPSLISIPPNIPKGAWGMTGAELAGVHSIFELFDSRPSPSIVQLKGRYVRVLKPFKFENTVSVQDGN